MLLLLLLLLRLRLLLRLLRLHSDRFCMVCRKFRMAVAIGVHIGLLLTLLFFGVFTMQAYKANSDPVRARMPVAAVLNRAGRFTSITACACNV